VKGQDEIIKKMVKRKKPKQLPVRVSNRRRVQREIFLPPMTTTPSHKLSLMEGRLKQSVSPKKLSFNQEHAKTLLAKGNAKAAKSSMAKNAPKMAKKTVAKKAQKLVKKSAKTVTKKPTKTAQTTVNKKWATIVSKIRVRAPVGDKDKDSATEGSKEQDAPNNNLMAPTKMPL
jgi:hypothetical protein